VRLELVGVCALVLSACPAPVTTITVVDGGIDPGLDGGVAKSVKATLRFKGPERLTNDFAQALSMPAADVCNELGQYPCTTLVHVLPLGGVDPYGSGLYEAPTSTSATTPMVVDRVALSACTVRAGLDLQDPTNAVLLKGLVVDAQGKLVDPRGPAATAMIVTLYQRALQRNPTRGEVDALLALAVDINAKGEPRAAGDWVISACFVVLSSAESVFY
jgi:hypothetical protein